MQDNLSFLSSSCPCEGSAWLNSIMRSTSEMNIFSTLVTELLLIVSIHHSLVGPLGGLHMTTIYLKSGFSPSPKSCYNDVVQTTSAPFAIITSACVFCTNNRRTDILSLFLCYSLTILVSRWRRRDHTYLTWLACRSFRSQPFSRHGCMLLSSYRFSQVCIQLFNGAGFYSRAPRALCFLGLLVT